jgi:trehalose 6-phosphate phosphatase
MEIGVEVALVTGRQLEIARAMVRLDAAYAASHGLEFSVDGIEGLNGGGEYYIALTDQVSREAEELARAGVTVEFKGNGISFHYRRAPDEEGAVAKIDRVIKAAPAAAAFRRLEGRKVIELRPDIAASKGTATIELAGQLNLKGLLAIGDDRTDVDMFDAVHALAARGVKGRAVAVVSPEVHRDVLDAADYCVEGIPGVEWLLALLAEAVTPKAE